MNLDTAIKMKDRLIGEGKDLIAEAVRAGMTQEEYLKRRTAIFDKMPSYLPSWVREQARAYLEGYFDSVKKHNIRFLYRVNGKYYSTTESADSGFPNWGTLPEEMWGNLGEFGGLYWVEEGKEPRPYFTTN